MECPPRKCFRCGYEDHMITKCPKPPRYIETSMYDMTNYGKLFSDELIEWLLEAGFIESQCQMSIYYKYAPYGSFFVCFILC